MQRLLIIFFLASIFFIGCGAAAPSSPQKGEGSGSQTSPGNLPKPPSGDVSTTSGNIPTPSGDVPTPSGDVSTPSGNLPKPPSGNLPKPPSGDVPTTSGNNVVVRSAVFSGLTDTKYYKSSGEPYSFSLHVDIIEDRIAAIIPDISYTQSQALTLTIAPDARVIYRSTEYPGPKVVLPVQTLPTDPSSPTSSSSTITVKSGDKEKVYNIDFSRYNSMVAEVRSLSPDTTIPIYGQENFAYITKNPTKNYILVKDLTLRGEHTPIAPDTSDSPEFQGTPFSGIFEGNDKTIRGLRIAIDENSPRKNFLGLFGKIDDGTVRNLRIIEPDITVQTASQSLYVGALAGRFSGTIDRVAVIGGSISGDITNAGGLVGVLFRNITNTGRLVGVLSTGLIRNSYASVALTGRSSVGGLVGSADGRIEYSYAIGRVSASRAGGLVGWWDGGSISSAYFDAELTEQYSRIGLGSAAVSTFYTNAADGFVYTNDRYTTKIRKINFPGWDFDTIWQIEEGRWPTLRWENP